MSSFQKPRILVAIVDDHEMVRMSLTMFLQLYEEIEIIGEASNGAEAIELCARTMPDIVLMDYLMPVMNGVEAARLLCEQYPNIRVMLLTATVEDNLIEQAYAAGVACFASKATSLELYNLIHLVYERGHCH
jgi:DNA-binding NarL/FixJ family response regulator